MHLSTLIEDFDTGSKVGRPDDRALCLWTRGELCDYVRALEARLAEIDRQAKALA